jgi:hypothetical protein
MRRAKDDGKGARPAELAAAGAPHRFGGRVHAEIRVIESPGGKQADVHVAHVERPSAAVPTPNTPAPSPVTTSTPS